MNVSTSAIATTFYGIPDPVTNARVVNDTIASECVLEWQHEDNQIDLLHYMVNQGFGRRNKSENDSHRNKII